MSDSRNGNCDILYLVSGTPNTHKNGFNRTIITDYAVPNHSVDLEQVHYRFAGVTSSQFYLSNLDSPLNVLHIDYNLSLPFKLKWNSNLASMISNSVVRIDSPYVQWFNQERRVYARNKISETGLHHHISDSMSSRRFDEGIWISDHSVLARTLNDHLIQYTISKFSHLDSNFLENTTAIKRQMDGYLSADGMLMYDSSISRLVYLYFYRNQYLVLDTNLNLVRIGQTIDTVSQAQVKLHSFNKGQVVTLKHRR